MYKNFCDCKYDGDGHLVDVSLKCPENFNFAFDVVDTIAETDPSRRALVWCDTEKNERTFNFDQLSRLSIQAANFLLEKGIKKGDRVMVILKRHYEYWYTILALHRIGAVAVPTTYMVTAEDIIYRVNTGEINSIICAEDDNICANVLEAKDKCSTLKLLFNVRKDLKDFLRLDTGLAGMPDKMDRIKNSATDPFIMYFTSGTTGYPKAVIHDYSYPLCHIMTAKFWQNVKEGGLHLSVADTGWGKASWGKIYGQWLCGSAVMVFEFEKFIPADLMEVISKYKVNTFCAPPTIYRFLVKSGLENYDFSSLEYAVTAGEALNPEIIYQFKEATGLEVHQGFGQTETTLLIADFVGRETRVGSMGKPSPFYRLDVVDANNQSTQPNEVGEIVVIPRDERKYGLCMGYLGDAQADLRVWKNGVYHTGDTAWRDEDGYYWYVGRIDDIIKSSGYRIGPFEIESVLIKHPAVVECAITGVPDEERGHIVKATIVLKQGIIGDDTLKKELQDFVKRETAPYKYPRVIEFVDELPKTISGKIRHKTIRDADTQH